MIFENRFDAGNKLLLKLLHYAHNPSVVIVAIPRGGLEIGSIIAQGLKAPLDVIFSKKISYPGEPEYAIGAVTSDEALFEKRPEVQPDYIHKEIQRVRKAIDDREHLYLSVRPHISMHNKTVILVDDGIATGKTTAAALMSLRKQQPQKIILAVPVAPYEAVEFLKPYADEIICLLQPQTLFGIGQFYKNFHQVSDEEAISLLRKSNL